MGINCWLEKLRFPICNTNGVMFKHHLKLQCNLRQSLDCSAQFITFKVFGIYAINFYDQSSIYLPLSTNCSAIYCYTCGSYLATDVIFSYNGSNLTTNTKNNCFSEQYENPNDTIQIFNNCNAAKILQEIGNIWLVPILCTNNSPFILASFIKPLYDCNHKKIKKCEKTHSKKGNFLSNYYIIDVNCCLQPSSISICKMIGKLNFNKVNCGEYSIRILNGKIKYILSKENIDYAITYVDYNTCIYYLISNH